jgi:hypothetical protein
MKSLPSFSMKNLLLLFLAALTLTVAPAAHAFERKQSWDDAANILDTLHVQMKRVHDYRERFGAGPEIVGEIQQLHEGIADLEARVGDHHGEAKEAITKAHDLWNMVTTVEVQFHQRARQQSIEIEVFHDEWKWR